MSVGNLCRSSSKTVNPLLSLASVGLGNFTCKTSLFTGARLRRWTALEEVPFSWELAAFCESWFRSVAFYATNLLVVAGFGSRVHKISKAHFLAPCHTKGQPWWTSLRIPMPWPCRPRLTPRRWQVTGKLCMEGSLHRSKSSREIFLNRDGSHGSMVNLRWRNTLGQGMPKRPERDSPAIALIRIQLTNRCDSCPGCRSQVPNSMIGLRLERVFYSTL